MTLFEEDFLLLMVTVKVSRIFSFVLRLLITWLTAVSSSPLIQWILWSSDLFFPGNSPTMRNMLSTNDWLPSLCIGAILVWKVFLYGKELLCLAGILVICWQELKQMLPCRLTKKRLQSLKMPGQAISALVWFANWPQRYNNPYWFPQPPMYS